MLDVRELDPEGPRPLSRAEYAKLVELGTFDDERVELLEGVIVRMSPQGPPHDAVIQRLTRVLSQRLTNLAGVRVQCAFVASDASQPQPDVAIVPPGDYDDAHPTEAWLIVEVAQTSLRKDRGVKSRLYAACGVPEYWVVNVADDLIEVHTDPENDAYTRVTPHRKGESIRLTHFPNVSIAVAEILR